MVQDQAATPLAHEPFSHRCQRFPDELREDALNRVAIAHFKVGYDGPVQVNLTKPTDNPELNEILLNTLKRWRFFPAIRSGVAIGSEFDIRMPVSVQ